MSAKQNGSQRSMLTSDRSSSKPAGSSVFGKITLFAALLCGLGAVGLSTPVSAQTVAAAYETGYSWDTMRRLVGVISPSASGTTAPYFATRYTYDADGQLILTEKGVLAAWQANTVLPSAWTGFTVQQSIQTSYDAVGNKLEDRTLGSDGSVQAVVQSNYDADDRLACSVTRMNLASIPAPSTTGACAPASPASANGPDRVTQTIYDAAGQTIQIRRAVSTAQEEAYATYGYSLDGKQTDVVDANGNHTQYVYDGFDRQTQWIFPSPTTTTYTGNTPGVAPSTVTGTNGVGAPNASDYEQYSYDNNGNRTTLQKRDGTIINYTYDALNRVTAKTFPANNAANVAYTYDLRNLQLSSLFSATGLGITTTYDALGRVLSSTNTTNGSSLALNYQYDPDGNRTQLTFPDGQAFSYAYDGLDRMTSITEVATGTKRSVIAYDSFGRRQSLSSSGADSTAYAYDPISRLQTLSHSFNTTASNMALGFSYNPASQITTHTTSNDAFDYTGDYNVTRPYTPNGLNQYTAAGPASFTYDANGNLTSDGSTTYVYDKENRLAQASGAKTATLGYDPNGRLAQTIGTITGTTRFLYDGDALVAEYDGSNTLLRRYIHGPGVDEPLVWYEGSTLAAPHFLHANHQGSVIAVTDASGNATSLDTYDAYGIPGSANTGRFGYTGQIWIPELGMNYYKARIYSPTLGRFLQTDPIGYKDDLDLYTYVKDDPVNHTDFTGDQIDWTEVGADALDIGANVVQVVADGAAVGETIATEGAALAGPAEETVAAGNGAATGMHEGAAALRASDSAGAHGPSATGAPRAGTSGGARAGKPFTRAGKAEVRTGNAAEHGGQTTCNSCGRSTVPAQQSKSGVTPPGNETHVDHIRPMSKGGDGSPSNGQVLCRDCNLRKGDD